jgi:hypothetical protein
MTLKELETWHRREAEGSCVAPKQRIAVVPTMRSPLKVPKKAETERGGILQRRVFWRQWSAMTVQPAEWRKLIARPLSRSGRLSFAAIWGRTGQRWAAGDLEVAKAIEIVIRLMPEAGCEHPEDLLSGLARRLKGGNGERHGLGPQILAHVSSDRSRLDHVGAYG